MRQVPNDIVQNLLRHLPKIMERIDLRTADNRTYNAVRITRKTLRRLEDIESRAGREKEEQENDRH